MKMIKRLLSGIIELLPQTRRTTNRRFRIIEDELRSVQDRLMILTDIQNAIGVIDDVQNELNDSAVGIAFSVEKLIKGIETVIESIQYESTHIKETIHSDSIRIDECNSQIKIVDSHIINKPVYWNSEFERNVVRLNWGEVTEEDDFAEKFIKLTSGMDGDSIETVIKILSRQKKYLSTNDGCIDLFTRAEQEELRCLNESFYKQIIRLNDELYAYRNYLLPIRHFEPSVFYYRHGLDMVDDIESIRDKTIVDVGGFIGDSVLILNEIPHKNIVTFEADTGNYTLLKRTIELNSIDNVITENLALGNSNGEIVLLNDGAMSSLIERAGVDFKGRETVNMCTLDSYVEDHKLKVGLIKVDIEGGEPVFLEGAKTTICTQKPIILLSIYHNAHDFFELKPLIESWDLGYRFKIHKPTYGNATSETLLIAQL